MNMPFGHYRGHDLAELPQDYLAWLSTLELREPLKSAVVEESLRRSVPQTAPVPKIVPVPAQAPTQAEPSNREQEKHARWDLLGLFAERWPKAFAKTI